jgi:hypothetical protein
MLAGKKGRRLKLKDFVLTWSGRKRQSSDEMLAALKTLAARQGGSTE